MTIVVTGATGNVGRPLVCQLAAAGARVRAITRSPQTAGFPAGVEAVSPAIDALSGASAVFLNSRALGDGLVDVVAAARRCGVTKLVALSAINADDDFSRQPSRFRGDRNKEVEQLAVDSGLDWVSLRPAVFASNFVGMW
uniref:SDR family oxidoreductase n=1 Tax=Mycobacterium sp. TaxID=1785 RepID=UPI003F9C36B4